MRALVLLAVFACSCTPVESSGKRSRAVDGEVEIIIDRYGWPHIFAGTLRDAAFGQGYAIAKDRMAQLELFRRTASGQLAEVYGSVSGRFVESDVTFRTMGLRIVAEQMWSELPKGRGRDIFEGYAAGVSQYLAELRAGIQRPPKGSEVLLSRAPQQWTPVDSLTVLRLMEMFLSFNADAEIERTQLRDAFSPQLWSEVMQFAPPSAAATVPDFYATASRSLPAPRAKSMSAQLDVLRSLRRVLPQQRRTATGTNAWAMSGSATASGNALLANDPHLPLSSPSILWGVHWVVTAGPDAVDITGTAFPGVPGVVFGHSAFVAWGICNGMFDQMDVYEETLSQGTVLFQGRQVPLEKRIERIANGVGGTLEVEVEVVPHHGPILPVFAGEGVPAPRRGNRALSVRWVAQQPSQEIDGLVALMFARDVAQARVAVRPIQVPPMAFVLADTRGEIGFQMTGKVPIRPPGVEPAYVLPGTGEAEWRGYVDPERLPFADPLRWVAASNNDPAGLSRDGNPFDGPVYLGYDWAEGFRVERLRERLAELDGRATLADMQALQADTVLLVAKRFMPFLLEAMDPGPLREKMATWNFDARADGVEATVFHSWLTRVLGLSLSDEVAALKTPVPAHLPVKQRMVAVLAALESGREASFWDDVRTPGKETQAEILRRALEGIDAVPWGQVHTVRFLSALPHVALSGGIDVSIPPHREPALPRGGGIESVDQGWPTLEDEEGRPALRFQMTQGAARRLSVEMTPQGPLAFDALPGGESSDLNSPHFRDEAARWQANAPHALARTRTEVEAVAESRLTFRPP